LSQMVDGPRELKASTASLPESAASMAPTVIRDVTALYY
jgi:hypothetical protein